MDPIFAHNILVEAAAAAKLKLRLYVEVEKSLYIPPPSCHFLMSHLICLKYSREVGLYSTRVNPCIRQQSLVSEKVSTHKKICVCAWVKRQCLPWTDYYKGIWLSIVDRYDSQKRSVVGGDRLLFWIRHHNMACLHICAYIVSVY